MNSPYFVAIIDNFVFEFVAINFDQISIKFNIPRSQYVLTSGCTLQSSVEPFQCSHPPPRIHTCVLRNGLHQSKRFMKSKCYKNTVNPKRTKKNLYRKSFRCLSVNPVGRHSSGINEIISSTSSPPRFCRSVERVISIGCAGSLIWMLYFRR